jgi:CheY-like chemotaxis protein
MPINSVLYVEDDPMSREVMDMLLTYQMQLPRVTIFEDSQNFMERVRALPVPPDVILLDIHVKPLTGFEMLRQLRDAEFSEATIVALTASVMNEEVEQLKKAGFDGVIAKPVNLDAFPRIWEHILKQEPVWGIL